MKASLPLPVVPDDYSLPSTLEDLKKARAIVEGSPWWKLWEFLRPFFLERGYILYKTSYSYLYMASPLHRIPSAADSFTLYGDRSNFIRYFEPSPIVFAARDSKNRDVVIKVVAKGREGNNELRILQLLQSEPLKSHSDKATIQVLEFLHYEDWVFAVMPALDNCDQFPFMTVDEILDFGEQLFSALAFLHVHCIAHLDVAYENTVMNHTGTVHDEENFRSSFPVRYSLIDFGWSEYAPQNGPGSGYLRSPLHDRRPTAAPESTSRPFDPYAADVWQASRLLYSAVFECIDEIPGLLSLFQDMTRWLPSHRPSMAEALLRLRDIRSEMRAKHPEPMYQLRDFVSYGTPVVPLRYWTTAIDGLRTSDFKFVCQFVFHFRKELLCSAWNGLHAFLNKMRSRAC
ncbi:Protein kinase US3 [Hypsizygus marmoreus]|uniref:Protein kinase US3 n=1 Tax=Hypsizygus marmoreus TaxID=39966 RepID=A0A369IZP6_HYPMA|nr:Protein kinase US3 [Hypsizygus marmoreus]